MAKLGVVCIGVTNDVMDYLHKPAAQAVWNNSPNKLFLRMTSDQIRSLITASAHGPAPVTGRAANLLPCLRTEPGRGADFLLVAEDRILPLRHEPTPLSYWLATTRHRELLAVKDEAAKAPLAKAIASLAERYPNGMGG